MQWTMNIVQLEGEAKGNDFAGVSKLTSIAFT